MFVNKIKKMILNNKIPYHIKQNYKVLDNGKLSVLRDVLRNGYFKHLTYSVGLSAEQYLSTDEGKVDLENHTTRRLDFFRKSFIPWLDSMKTLSSARILEIGCGTGCSTLALAEQGAMVTGIDIDDYSLSAAEKRMQLYGVAAGIVKENATGIGRFSNRTFDFIIYFAALEHMTIDERILSLKKAWNLLPEKGVLVVIETPNRLWLFDDHTSMLPFFHWLPDRLAFYYSSKSPRKNFYGFSDLKSSAIPIEFYRLGRGVSYHEFELAFDQPIEKIKVIGDLQSFLLKGVMNPVEIIRYNRSTKRTYAKMLKVFHPGLDPAFSGPYLNLAIVKK